MGRILFSWGGWALFLAVGIVLVVSRSTQPTAMESAAVAPTVPCESKQPSASVQQFQAPDKPIMEVFVKPHPPNFTSGRWVQFDHYATRREKETEKVDFHHGSIITTVNSEAVEWPRQRPASTVK